MGTVLVVDDQIQPRRLLIDELEEAGFDVVEASDGEEAWERFQRIAPDVVITDMMMPKCDGLELLRRIRSHSEVPVIIFSGYGSVETAVDAVKAGAENFLSSLDADVDALVNAVRASIQSPQALPSGQDLESRIVGTSDAITQVRWQVAGLAPLGAPALITGEPGAGRTTVVRALHELGSSAAGALTTIDARSFAPPCRLSAPGAVHIENVEALTPEAQAYWAERLRKAEQDSFNGRLRVFASSTEPTALADANSHSSRLFQTLMRFHIELPALRDRVEDIAPIAQALIDRIGNGLGRHVRPSPASLAFLGTCHLPGNVRQLERVLERAIAYTRGRTIQRDSLKGIVADLDYSVASIREQHRELERHRLIQTIRETGGNITHTAEALGKSRAAIYRLMQKYGIALKRGG